MAIAVSSDKVFVSMQRKKIEPTWFEVLSISILVNVFSRMIAWTEEKMAGVGTFLWTGEYVAQTDHTIFGSFQIHSLSGDFYWEARNATQLKKLLLLIRGRWELVNWTIAMAHWCLRPLSLYKALKM